jgi:lipopolysaccharide export system protein LptA
MKRPFTAVLCGILAGALLPLGPGFCVAYAQDTPNAVQGFSQNRNQPVNIEAASLEVRDKSKEATFLGNVRMTQGDTTLRSKTMKVFYDQDAGPGAAMKAAQPGPGGQQQIKRLEAGGGIVVTQKEQTVTGDTGIFDMKANTVTVLGKVVLTQGANVLEGDRLVVDLTSGSSKLDKAGGKGRVKALFVPSSSGNDVNPFTAPRDGAKDGAKDSAKSDGAKPNDAKPNARPSGLY